MEEDKHNHQAHFVYRGIPLGKTLQTIKKTNIPFAVHYNPTHTASISRYDKNAKNILSCQNCMAMLSSSNYVEDNEWQCQFCFTMNRNESKLVLPQLESSSDEHTYEIQLSQVEADDCYLFVVDLSMEDKEITQIKGEIGKFVENAPHNTRIGLITYSQYVYVYNLKDKINTVVCVAAHIPYTSTDLSDLLQIQPNHHSKYLVKVGQCRQQILKKVNSIKGQSQYKIVKGKRQRSMRGTGQALNIAVSICQLSPLPVRIVSMIGGPCTYGVGKVISTDCHETMRSIVDLEKEPQLKYHHKANIFYGLLRDKILSRGTIVDMFIFCVEEVGLAEMYSLVRVSGGNLVMHEQFSCPIFTKSFQKLYMPSEDDPYLMGSMAILTVIHSNHTQINGALGQCYPIKNASLTSSKKQIGYGGTNSWYIGSIDTSKTITIIYDIINNQIIDYPAVMQFQLAYTDRQGSKIIKITTVELNGFNYISEAPQYFSQEAAIVALARLYVHKSLYEQKRNLRLWIDKTLIQWVSVFANYIKGDERSFSLPPKMKHLPQYFYYFRRSAIFRKTNISLDEYYYQCHLLNRQTIENCLLMIQPALLAYSLECIEPTAVNLDQNEMKDSSVLLLDTFFNVVLWHGENVHSWEEEGYHQKENYQHVKELIDAPTEDIQYLLGNRFPYPGFWKTHPNHSKERYLKSRVSPAKSIEENENMVSDDADLFTFTRYLIDLIVNEKVI